MRELLKASSWSIVTELVAKVISPISFLILTKILAPEDFGVVAVATTFISFIYIITDLGVSQVIIQDPNTEPGYRKKLNNTCFWFNLFIGVLIFLLTFLFAKEIAFFFGNDESALVVKVMAFKIIFYSLSSIQNANLKKELNFKFLFFTRLVTIGMPVLIAIPLALLGGGYWAIIIANVLGNVLNTIILWSNSKWKPQNIIDLGVLKGVLNKGIWSSFEQLIIWVPIGLDAYLIGNYLTSRDLGLYTTSRTLFSAAIAITLGAILPVLYSHLSRIQNSPREFKNTVLFAQKIMYTLAGTMGISVFLLSDIVEVLFFNDEWAGISNVLGIVFLVMSNGYFYSVLQEALRSKGYFKDLFLVKFVSIFFIIPILFVAVKTDIYTYSFVRGAVLYIWIFGTFYFSQRRLGITFISFVKNSKSLLIVFSVVVGLSVLIDQFSVDTQINIPIWKLTLFVAFITTILFLEKPLFLKIKKLVLKRK